MKKIYCFGNPLLEEDNLALQIADEMDGKLKGIEFVKCTGPDFLLGLDEKEIIIMDAVKGIKKPEIIEDLNKISQTKTATMHDFDLGTVLKLMKETGQLKKIMIIGLPMNGDENKIRKDVADLLKSSWQFKGKSLNNKTA